MEKFVHGHKDGKADLNPFPFDSPKSGIGKVVWVIEDREHCYREGHGKRFRI